MNQLYAHLQTPLAFIFVLGLIVFIHEFGHYFVAKMCGVRITIFSIGFGKELFGFNDKSGTRWKVSALPLGGYVKMFGDATAASTEDTEALKAMSTDERKVAFHFKPLWQKALVVVAGPVANFMLSTAIFTYFILANGLPIADPVVGTVVADSPAAQAGILSGDRITQVNDTMIKEFSDVSYIISTNVGTPVTLHITRGNQQLEMTMTPKLTEDGDGLGNKITHPMLGIKSAEMKHEPVGVVRAVGEGGKRTYMICASTLKVIGQIFTGKRDTRDLKGPVGIAQLSGQAAEHGFGTLLGLIALISANLGLMNLLPLPVLDGGHLLFYSLEAIRGKALGAKTQDFSFRIGFALIAMLMAYSFINDFTH